MVHQVAAHRGMHPGGHGYLQLGAHAIGAGDQDWLFPFFGVQGEQGAKSADASEHPWGKRPAGVVADTLLSRIGQRDVYSRICIFHEQPADDFWRYERTNLPVVLFRENVLCHRTGFGSTLVFFAGDSQLKTSGTTFSS